MPEEKGRHGGVALAGAAGAGVGALAAMLLSGRAQTQTPPGVDPALWEAILALVASVDAQNQRLGELITALNNQGGTTFKGWPPNLNKLVVTRQRINALDTPYRLPQLVVPDGQNVIVKGGPTNGGIVYVASSAPEVLSPETAWPLILNENRAIPIKNTENLYVAGLSAFGGVVGDFAIVSLEQD